MQTELLDVIVSCHLGVAWVAHSGLKISPRLPKGQRLHGACSSVRKYLRATEALHLNPRKPSRTEYHNYFGMNTSDEYIGHTKNGHRRLHTYISVVKPLGYPVMANAPQMQHWKTYTTDPVLLTTQQNNALVSKTNQARTSQCGTTTNTG